MVNFIEFEDYQLKASRPSIILMIVLSLTALIVLLNGLWFMHGVCSCLKGGKIPWKWRHIFDTFVIAMLVVGYIA